MELLNLKVPPHSLDVERSTLGALLIDKEAVTKVADFLHSEDFYHDSHGLIYQVIFDLFDRRQPIVILVTIARHPLLVSLAYVA